MHFPDRFALAAELLDSIDGELSAAIEPVRVEPASLDTAIRRVVHVWCRNGPVLRAISDASSQDPRLEELYRWGFLQRSIDRVFDVVLLCQLDGSVPADIDPTELATLIGLTAERYMDDRFGSHPQADPVEVGQLLVTVYGRILGRR